MYFSMIFNAGAEQPFCRSPLCGYFWTYSAHVFGEVILMFSILIFTLERVCFSLFFLCRSPIVRSCCSRFGSSEVILQSCDHSATANLSFGSRFQWEIIQRMKESEAATGVVLEKRDVLKNCCSESWQVKFAVKILEKYLWRSSFLVNLQSLSLQTTNFTTPLCGCFWKMKGERVCYNKVRSAHIHSSAGIYVRLKPIIYLL